MLLGSHLSIAGGLDKALVSAAGYGFQAVGLFLRNQRQWKASPLSEETVRLFRQTRRRCAIASVVAHGSYLVNLAGEKDIRAKSIVAVAEDLDRCGRLGIEYLVLHPGSHKNATEGIARITEALNRILSACRRRRPTVLLETTAGQGNCIGHRFEELAEIFRRLERPARFGVCFDTAHVFAAGYDLRTPEAYQATMTQFDETLGLPRLRAVHCNDSLPALGARVDRHAHIGQGEIALAGFAPIVNDPRLRAVPFILETPKGLRDDGRDWDEINAKTLRGLTQGD